MELNRFLKSCDGTIKLYVGSDVYWIRASQTINYKKFEKVGTKYHNIFLDEIIQNVQITSKNEDNIFYGIINLPSHIICKNITSKKLKIDYLKLQELEEKLKQLDNQPRGIDRFTRRQELFKQKKLLKEQKSIICLSTPLTYKCTRQLRSYWSKLLKEVDHLFFEDTPTYLIVPQQPFSQTIITTYTTILSDATPFDATNREEAVRELLYDVGFQYYYKSSYIGDLFTQSDTKNLEDAILDIKQFYLDKFKYRVKSDFELYITLNQRKEDSDQLVFDFMLIEPSLGNKYVSFTNILLKPRINDLIDRIKRKNFYLYTYAQHLNTQDTTSVDCLESYYEKDYTIKTKSIEKLVQPVDSYMTLFGISKQPIKIINAYNHPNKYHTYCANFFLIQIGDKYFEISIKLITYSRLKYDKDFFDKFQKSLISNFKPKMYFDAVLPACVEIYVNHVDPNLYKIPINMYYVDTANIYYDRLLPLIVTTPIDLTLLLVQLWFRTLITLTKSGNITQIQKSYLFNSYVCKSQEEQYFQSFTNILLKNPYISCFLLRYVEHTTHFVKILKYTKNIDKVIEYIYTLNPEEIEANSKEIQKTINALGYSDFIINLSRNLFEQFVEYVNRSSYTIWYLSENICITDYPKLLDFLSKNIVRPSDIADIQISNQFTNFYTIFRQSDFVHSIRQLDNSLKDEIKKFTISPSYHLGMHYSNNLRYQILHLNICNSTIDSYVDVIGNQYNIHSDRYISQYDIFNTDYKDADILVSRTLMIGFNEFMNIYSKQISIQTIIEKFDSNSPEKYLPNIRQILINSGINLID